jgi:hypothetical protein
MPGCFVSTPNPCAIKRTTRGQPAQIFRQLLAENQNPLYKGSRMNEAIDSVDHGQGGKRSQALRAYRE